MRADPRSAIGRLQTVRGHLDSIVRMVEEDRYCIDVLHQISAVQGALDRVRREIFEAHVRSCVAERILSGRTEEAVRELVGAVFGASPASRDREEAACSDHLEHV